MTLELAKEEMMTAYLVLIETREQFAHGSIGSKALELAENEYLQARNMARRLQD